MAISATSYVSNAASRLWSGTCSLAKPALWARVTTVALMAFASLQGAVASAPQNPSSQLQSYPYYPEKFCLARPSSLQTAVIQTTFYPTILNRCPSVKDKTRKVAFFVHADYVPGHGMLYYTDRNAEAVREVVLSKSPKWAKFRSMAYSIMEKISRLSIFEWKSNSTAEVQGDTIYVNMVFKSTPPIVLGDCLVALSYEADKIHLGKEAERGLLSQREYVRKVLKVEYTHLRNVKKIDPGTKCSLFVKETENAPIAQAAAAKWESAYKHAYRARHPQARV